MRRWRPLFLGLSVAVLAALGGNPASGQSTITPNAALLRVLATQPASADWFADTFLRQIPLPEVERVVADVTRTLGPVKSVSPNADGTYTATFEHGSAAATIHLDAAGKIDELSLRSVAPRAVSVDAALAALRALPGDVAYVLIDSRSERAALRADAPLAVGSAFKLAVLCALRDRIDHGDLHWSDVATLQPADRSVPSGVIQTWPVGTSLKLDTLATLMISRSDNTAANVLMRVLGHPALAPYAFGNDPFLTTRQFAVLKSSVGASQRATWRSASRAGRQAVLDAVDALPLPTVTQLDLDPADTDIEWHYTVRQLCGLMSRVATLPLMSVNPGAANPSDWDQVAFKGGSDSGVLNLTTQARTKSGRSICLSLTVNDRTHAVDENTVTLRYASVLSALAAER